MPAPLTLATAAGSSSTGHLDPGLLMSPTLVMGVLTMRGISAFGDIDLMAPFSVPIMSGVSVTSILVSTAFTEIQPGPFAAVSTTAPLVFAAPILPDLTASASTTSILVTAKALLPISSASLSQTLALFTAQTQVFLDHSNSTAQMIYPLPFTAGTQMGLSPSASLSSMSAAVTALTKILPDLSSSISDTEFILLAPANVSGSSASASATTFLLASPIPFLPDMVTSVSDTEYAIPFVKLNLATAGLSKTDIWILAPGRVHVRKVRGAGARNVELVGAVPLGG